MDKIKISEVGTKFKDIPKDTLSKLRYEINEKKLILEVFGFAPLLVCCDSCGKDNLVKEGAMFRCLGCNSLFLVGFGTNGN